MNRYLVVSLLTILMPITMYATELTVQGEVRLENSSEPTKIFGLDVRAVVFSSDGQQLTFSVQLDQAIIPYLQENSAQAVVQFLFDSDGNPSSGGTPFGSTDTGFEFVTIVYACKEFEDGKICAGDAGDITGYTGEYETDGWDAGASQFTPVHDFLWEGGDAEIDGNTIRAAISYEDFGGVSEQALRIVILARSGRPIDIPSVVLTLE